MKNYRVLLICLSWLCYAKRISKFASMVLQVFYVILLEAEENSECYRKGLIRGKLGKTCHLPPIYSLRCQEEFADGCMKFRGYAYCTLGVESALQGFPCEGLEDVPEALTQTFQKCCNLCSNGLQAGIQGACDQINKGYPFHDCCQKARADETSIWPKVFKQGYTDLQPCTLCFPLSTGHAYCICGYKGDRRHELEKGFTTKATPSEYLPGQSIDTRLTTESSLLLPEASQRKNLTMASCPDGFVYNIRAKECQDVDECKLGTARCEAENKGCKNLNGSFECYDCPNGFKPAHNGQCIAACQPGYHLNETIKECEDIDECILSPNPCQSNEKCFNKDGGHTCVAKKMCEPGHELNILGYCGDIDECSKGLHNCTFEHSMCQNIFGGFKCVCKEGFRLGAGRDVCEDIDECKDQFSPCMSNKKCINTLGSFECKGCEAGYKEDEAGFCVDINECEENTHKCGKYSCMNTHGSHECSCDLGGYKFENGTCVDINECEEDTSYSLYTCGLNQACRNTDGSYECYDCPRNMVKGLKGCVCKKGFKSINGTCVDIDECSEKENICGHEICYNLEGSYECHPCPSGLRSVERRCEDINECNERNACAEDELCTNIFADYKCTSLRCEKGYERVGHNSKQCKQTRKTFSKKKPAAISVNTFAVRSSEQIPVEGVQIYTMSVYSKLKCEFRLHLQSVNNHSDKAVSTLSDWKTQEENNSVTLILLRKLEGPQDVELSLDCVYGTRILQRSKIFIFVSKY